MKHLTCWMFLSTISFAGLAAEPTSNLPQGFSQEPNCISGSICFAEGVTISDEQYFDAVMLAVTDKRNANSGSNSDLRVKSVTIAPNDPNTVGVRLGYPTSTRTDSYVLEMTAGQWVIASEAVRRP